jgi:hypothetical protein
MKVPTMKPDERYEVIQLSKFMWEVWEVTDIEDGEASGRCAAFHDTEAECLAWIAQQPPRPH